MIIRRINIPFDNQMSRTQVVLGWIYLAVHMVILPLLLSLYAAFSPNPVTDTQSNLVYFGIGALFVLCVMLPYLRRSFDLLLDRLRLCLLTILIAMMINYALSTFVAIFLMLGESLAENPNNSAIMELAEDNSGVIRGLAIFIGPVIEEVLYRGVAFGSIRRRSRGWAYVVSAALFALSHVWQYALAYQDAGLLLYALQYIPVTLALTWAYERSGSIWTSIFFHMGYNALSFYVLSML